MSVFGVKLPDVGEGVAEAELIEWHVSVGDLVTTESVLAEVMTDKVTVEISAPVAGIVAFLHGEPGDKLAVGSEFVGIEQGSVPIESPAASGTTPADAVVDPLIAVPAPVALQTGEPPTVGRTGAHFTAAPAVRQRASALGIDLAAIPGSGPDGRVVHADLDRHLAGNFDRHPVGHLDSHRARESNRGLGVDSSHIEPIRGLRRRIAERLTASWTEIPHITYVEAVDATELEALRAELNRRGHSGGARLTIMPFLVRALLIAIREQPRLNATYDAGAQALCVYEAVHVGIATQTSAGLMVPVVRHAEALGLWALASEIGRVTELARNGNGSQETLTGSTITVTSLGALGGLATTPIINQPEVAIIGVNKLETRPVWRNGSFEPRLMFNLSSSFDHRIIDGWDAATFVQRLKSLLEMPALLFVDERD